MQETEEIIMATANLTMFLSCRSRWFWRQDSFSLVFLFFFSYYCPYNNAIHTGQDTNGNGDESDEICRNKSSVCFHVVECRCPIQLTIRFIFVGDQFETVEIRCMDGDGDKPRA